MVSVQTGPMVRILHDRVGVYEKGRVVPASTFDDAQYLGDLGAIEQVPDDAQDEPIRPTLNEAIHSESPPTLPNADYTSATTREKMVAARIIEPGQGIIDVPEKSPSGKSTLAPQVARQLHDEQNHKQN